MNDIQLPAQEAASAKNVTAAASASGTDSLRQSSASGDGRGYEHIARLAYFYWEARGCPEGSPEEDWFRAENELKLQ